jgi:RNase P subunit RPR2
MVYRRKLPPRFSHSSAIRRTRNQPLWDGRRKGAAEKVTLKIDGNRASLFRHPYVMHARRTIPIPLMVVGFVVLLPAIIPAAIMLAALQKHRLRKAAKSFVCVNCGRVLGTGALARADEAWSEHMRELMRQHPGVRLRMLRTVHAICLGCDTCYRFREKERTFFVEEPRPAGVHA